jgi:hypothetical protein
MWLCGLYGHLLLHATIAPKIGGKNWFIIMTFGSRGARMMKQANAKMGGKNKPTRPRMKDGKN